MNTIKQIYYDFVHGIMVLVGGKVLPNCLHAIEPTMMVIGMDFN